MASGIPGVAQRRNNYGVTTSRATATLPQSTTGNLFSITGGRIIVTTIVGEVTVAIQNQANNTKLTATNVAASITTDICAVVSTANAAVGTLFGITGTFATAASLGTAVPQTNEIIVGPGFIRLDCAASNTGSMKWDLLWIPLDGTPVVAAV